MDKTDASNEQPSLRLDAASIHSTPTSLRESSNSVDRSSCGFGNPSGQRFWATSLARLNRYQRPPRPTMDFRPDFARPQLAAVPQSSGRHHETSEVVDADPRMDEKLLEDIIFLFNNLAGSNVDKKAVELKTVFCRGSPNLLIKFVRYFVSKRVSLEPNNHMLYLQLLNMAVGTYLVDMVLDHAIQCILNCLNSVERLISISEKSAFKALGNWIGLTTYGIGKPLDRTKLDLQRVLTKCNSTTIVSTLPMVCRLLAHLNDTAHFESPDIQRVFLILKHLHNDKNISMNLKFEIEALFTELRERELKSAQNAPFKKQQMEKLAFYQADPQLCFSENTETSLVACRGPETDGVANITKELGGLREDNEHVPSSITFKIVIRPTLLASHCPLFLKYCVTQTVHALVTESLCAAKEVADNRLGRLQAANRDFAAYEETIQVALLRPIAQVMFPNMSQECFQLQLMEIFRAAAWDSGAYCEGFTATQLEDIVSALTEDNIYQALEFICNESCKQAFAMIQELVKNTIMAQKSNASRQSPPVMYGSYLAPVSPFDMLSMTESHPCASIAQMHYPTVANPPPGHDKAAFSLPPSPSSFTQTLISQPFSKLIPESYEQCFQPPPPQPPRIEMRALCNEIIVYLKEVIHPLFKTPVKSALLQSYHDLEAALNSFLSLPCKTTSQVAILVDKTVYMFLTAFTEPPLPSHQDKSTFCSVFFHLIAILRNHVDKAIVSAGATRVVIEAVKTGRFNQEALMIMIKKGVVLCDRIDQYVVQQMQEQDASANVFARHMHRAYGSSNVDQFSSTFPGIYRQLISLLREY